MLNIARKSFSVCVCRHSALQPTRIPRIPRARTKCVFYKFSMRFSSCSVSASPPLIYFAELKLRANSTVLAGSRGGSVSAWPMSLCADSRILGSNGTVFLLSSNILFYFSLGGLSCHLYFSELFRFAESRNPSQAVIFMSCTFRLHIRLCGNRTRTLCHGGYVSQNSQSFHVHIPPMYSLRLCNHFHLLDACMCILHV